MPLTISQFELSNPAKRNLIERLNNYNKGKGEGYKDRYTDINSVIDELKMFGLVDNDNFLTDLAKQIAI